MEMGGCFSLLLLDTYEKGSIKKYVNTCTEEGHFENFTISRKNQENRIMHTAVVPPGTLCRCSGWYGAGGIPGCHKKPSQVSV